MAVLSAAYWLGCILIVIMGRYKEIFRNIIVRYFWYQLFDFDDEAALKGYTSRASRETYLSFGTGWAYNGGKVQ